MPLPELVAEHGSPAYVLDEADFRARAGAFRDAFARLRRLLRRQGVPVHHGGPLGGARRGCASTSAPAGSCAVAERAGFDPARIGFHGNNKSSAELRRAVELGVGRIIVDSFVEIERLAAVVAELGAHRPGAWCG